MVRLPNSRTPSSIQLPYVPKRLSLQVPMPKEE
jgi:hypothetical protein